MAYALIAIGDTDKLVRDLRQIHTMTTDEQARCEALKEHNDELEAARG